MAAQTDLTPFIMLAAVGGLAYWAYEQGWFTTTTASTSTTDSGFPAGVSPISTSVMTLAGQQAYVAQLVAAGYPVSQINSSLQALATQEEDCVAPSVWTPLTSFANSANNGCNNPAGLPATSTQPPATTPPATSPPPVTTTPTIVTSYSAVYSALESAAGTTSLTPDQWSYYWGMLPGHSPLSAQDMATLLSDMGITDRSQPIPLGTFVAGLQSLNQNEFGISGLGNYFGVPHGAIHGGW